MTMKLLLVDGTNAVMRCASVQTDQPRASVIASAGRIIRRAAEETIRATHLVVAFDAPGHSFRKALYPEYKAHRADRQRDTERWAMEACAAFEAAGVYCVFVPEFEADDVIATVAARATAVTPSRENQTNEVHVLSGDSDLLALCCPPAVRSWQFGRKDEDAIVERSAEWIGQKYGIASPAQLTDYKTLVGEPGDNVKGVHGVGPVRARQLLRQYGTIDMLAEFGMLGSAADAERVRHIRDLLTLRADAPIPQIKPSACRLARRSAAA